MTSRTRRAKRSLSAEQRARRAPSATHGPPATADRTPPPGRRARGRATRPNRPSRSWPSPCGSPCARHRPHRVAVRRDALLVRAARHLRHHDLRRLRGPHRRRLSPLHRLSGRVPAARHAAVRAARPQRQRGRLQRLVQRRDVPHVRGGGGGRPPPPPPACGRTAARPTWSARDLRGLRAGHRRHHGQPLRRRRGSAAGASCCCCSPTSGGRARPSCWASALPSRSRRPSCCRWSSCWPCRSARSPGAFVFFVVAAVAAVRALPDPRATRASSTPSPTSSTGRSRSRACWPPRCCSATSSTASGSRSAPPTARSSSPPPAPPRWPASRAFSSSSP